MTYDEAASQLTPLLKQQPGFICHVAFATSDGFTLSELWESKEQHDRWFSEQAKPNVRLEITVEAIDVPTSSRRSQEVGARTLRP